MKRKALNNPPLLSAFMDEKVWFDYPGLAPEKRVQGLHWGLIPCILSICFLWASLGMTQDLVKGKVIYDAPPLSPEDSVALCRLPELVVPEIYKGPDAPLLPVVVDNSQNIYWRPVFAQVAYECGQASGIGQNFTYEINRLRNLPSNLEDNQYPTHFCWNFGNGGDGYYGVSYFHSFEILKMCGTPNVTDYGGMSAGGPKRWMTGYLDYNKAMHNRISKAFQIDVSNEEGVNALRHWIHDHLEGSDFGGVASFYASCPYGMPTLPPGTPEAGKYVMTSWSYANHAMCIAGYHDSIRWDYNSDGQYTNHIDINGDMKVDVRDWEIGGLKFSNNYSGGPGWGNNGFCYMMYKSLADAYGNGGIWNNAVHVLDARADTEPLLAARITMKHDCREKVRVRMGYSLDENAQQPEFLLNYPIVKYQGGPYYMQGGSMPEDKTIDFGLDLVHLLNMVPSGIPARWFLVVDEDDPSGQGTGEIEYFSLMDYTNGINEIPCAQTNVPLVENGRTILYVNHTVTYNQVLVETDELPDATVFEPYEFQLQAAGGSSPYLWDFNLNFTETGNIGTFPGISGQQLIPTNSSDGYAIQQLGFSLPFYGHLFDEMKVYVDGYIMVDELLSWPYQVDPFLAFTKNRYIAPFMSDLRLYSDLGDGMWYEGNNEYAIFRWKASVDGQYGTSALNFAVKLLKSGEIKYYYGNGNSFSDIEWVSGVSAGDNHYYQFTEVSNDPVVPPNKVISLKTSEIPSGFQITRDGIFSGTPVQPYSNFEIRFRVTDRDNITATKTLFFSTDGTNYLVIDDVQVTAGDDDVIEYGDTVRLTVSVKNLGDNLITDAVMKVSEDDLFIMLTDTTEFLGDFSPGETKTFPDAFVFEVSPEVPDNHELDLKTLIVADSGDEWSSHIYLNAYAPVVTVGNVLVDDGNNGGLEPGETADLLVTLVNSGGADVTDATALLSTSNPYITINTSTVQLPVLSATGSAVAEFSITASPDTPLGTIIELGILFTGALGYSSSDMIILLTGLDIEDFETGNFQAYPWTFSGDADWIIEEVNPYQGIYCARSGQITDNQKSVMTIQLCFLTGGNIRFFRKVSSEVDYDFLNFYIDGDLRGNWAGEAPWDEVSYPVDQGLHYLSWSYEKDYSLNGGSDCGWVDLIRFPAFGDPSPVLQFVPDHFDIILSSGMQEQYLLSLSNEGTGPMTYELSVKDTSGVSGWLEVSPVEGAMNPGETDEIEVICSSAVLQTGSYAAVILIRDHMGNEYEVPVSLQVTPVSGSLDGWSVVAGLRVFPNPFTERVEAEFTLPEPMPITLRVLGPDGKLVKSIMENLNLPAGLYRTVWDGWGPGMTKAPSGVYYMVLTSPEGRTAVKMVFLR